jgi:hypothetical protein
MDQSKHAFISGLDGDSADYAIEKGRWVNMRNMRTGSADALLSNTSDVEPIGSTVPLTITLPTGTNIALGSCYDEAGDRILRLNWNSLTSHGIYALYPDGTTYTVLLSADVTGGLGFSKYSPIHSCFVLNGNLYWVDSTNQQPRRLNIDAGIKAYQSGFVTTVAPYSLPVAQSVISWIRRPPGLCLSAVKSVDGSYANNFVRYGSFLFARRYQYRDYEFSTLSAYSKLVPYNDNDDNATNRVDVTFPLGEQFEQDVLQVDLVAIYLDEGVARIVRSWNRTNAADAAAMAAHNAGTPLTYAFFADQTGTVLASTYVDKLFDSVPIFAETTERGRNRTFMADYTIGYDASTVTSSLTATTGIAGGSAAGGIIGPVVSSSAITGVTIGGVAVAYVAGNALPVGTLQLGTFSTPSVGPAEVVVITVAGACDTVRVRYSTDGVSFTNVDQAYTADGDYTFPGIPINANDGTFLTWICALLN